jgi:hypothetical protein
MRYFGSESPPQSLQMVSWPATSASGPASQTLLHSSSIVRRRGEAAAPQGPNLAGQASSAWCFSQARTVLLPFRSLLPFLRKIAVAVRLVKTRSCRWDQLACTKGQVTS